MTQEAVPTTEGRFVTLEDMDSTPTGLNMRHGVFALPYVESDTEVDGEASLEVLGQLVRLKVYSQALGRRVYFIGLASPAEATSDIKDALVAAGLLEDGGASPLDLDGGDLSAGAIDAVSLTVSEAASLGSAAIEGTLTVGTDAAIGGTLSVVGAMGAAGAAITGNFQQSGGSVGVFGATPSTKLTVTGSRGGNAALASLLTQLATYGLITDSSS